MAFRYAQFCPLARAAEIIGERWTLLVVRELILGPKRFNDIKGALHGVSTSVLASRLAALEERGLVSRSELPPPALVAVYELTETGRALEPTLHELGRWGARFLSDFQPGDHIEPDWLRLAVLMFGKKGPSPARTFRVCIADGDREVSFAVSGGRRGTVLRESVGQPDASLRVAVPLTLLGIVAGAIDPVEAARTGQIEVEGDLDALADFPALFDMGYARPGSASEPGETGSEADH